ncbi:transposase family protein, partial [Olsenella profusa]
MDAQAGMLAQLFERSMGLGPEWRVSEVWFEERGGAPDELHVRVEHVRGQAVGCPECGRRCGTYDTRERTWRHLDIWQYETVVHCAVPRADCPEHGVR